MLTNSFFQLEYIHVAAVFQFDIAIAVIDPFWCTVAYFEVWPCQHFPLPVVGEVATAGSESVSLTVPSWRMISPKWQFCQARVVKYQQVVCLLALGLSRSCLITRPG